VPLDPTDIQACIEVLETLVEDRSALAVVDKEVRNRLFVAAGRVSRPERNELRALTRALRKQKKIKVRAEDRALMQKSEIRRLRAQVMYPTPAIAAQSQNAEAPNPTSKLHKERACYVCKKLYQEVHFFYDQMCKICGDYNYDKREQTCDLSGRTAYISGARLKIGYQAAIMLLRAGARVLVSTRFPRDAA